jgi:hypothetical protein
MRDLGQFVNNDEMTIKSDSTSGVNQLVSRNVRRFRRERGR